MAYSLSMMRLGGHYEWTSRINPGNSFQFELDRLGAVRTLKLPCTSHARMKAFVRLPIKFSSLTACRERLGEMALTSAKSRLDDAGRKFNREARVA
jgi:hypothetical protein